MPQWRYLSSKALCRPQQRCCLRLPYARSKGLCWKGAARLYSTTEHRQKVNLLTAKRAPKRSICTTQNRPTPFFLISHKGISGFLAQKLSLMPKAVLDTTKMAVKEMIIGSFQDSLCPPKPKMRRKIVIVMENIIPPRKSSWYNLPEPADVWLLLSEWDSICVLLKDSKGSRRPARKEQIRAIGAWPRNDLCDVWFINPSRKSNMQQSYHLQPIVSANSPPSGPPKLRPAIAATFT